MKTNKEKIKDLVTQVSKQKRKGVDANWVAEKLGLQRSFVSGILNELVRENSLRKVKSRPVLFYDAQNESINPGADPFFEYLGHDGSLGEQIQKCRLAANYPNRGMPILLLGPSGVGKSLLAEYIYRYAKYIHNIPDHAPFVVLNCADYANNPELLSSILFGYKKGAFTGAAENTKGLFEQADQGYLFLDEVHRLPPEGQEKLFRYIDRGVISRIGDSQKEYTVNVRLIFATTEDISALLNTFIRRVPVTVEIPKYSERRIEERYQLICHLFSEEAETMNSTFQISQNVFNQLISLDPKGNIGSLKNAVKLCCASAHARSSIQPVKIKVQDLSNHYRMPNNMENLSFVRDPVKISANWKPKTTVMFPTENLTDPFPYKEVIKILNRYENHTISAEWMHQRIYKILKQTMEKLIYLKEDPAIETNYKRSVENILDYIQNHYGFQYNSTAVTVITRILFTFQHRFFTLHEPAEKELKQAESLIRSCLYRYYKMSAIFFEMARQALDYESCPEATRIFIALYFYHQMDTQNNLCNAIILAHGPSTASSIASMANRIFGQYIFEAFDMPFDISKNDIVFKMKSYLQHIDTSKGLLLLVDTGSLLDAAAEIEKSVSGDLGMINNVTTQMTVEIGERILNHEPVSQIVEKAAKHNITVHTYIPQKEKPPAIVVCCLTGIGTARKIRDMLSESFLETKIEIIAYEYEAIHQEKSQCEIFQKYRILLFISTMELGQDFQPSLQLNDLMTEKGESLIHQILKPQYPEKVIQKIIQTIIKKFTLENIIGQLTILNPTKVIEDVEDAVDQLELFYQTTFSADLKRMLYIHICIMIERLMLEKTPLAITDEGNFKKCHSKFISCVKKSLSVIEDKYNVSVNIREIKLIYNLLEHLDNALY
nr:sigma 54-interacting transcriptional regulator [uncultured Anaerostipes sp.]